MGRRAMRNGEEYDAYTAWRGALLYLTRAGAVKAIKRRTHKRERREAAQLIRLERTSA
ncbi:hypothetical protein GCM10009851_14060 [Herbiconiux moechotypicola]|uniref:Uncharacterized protein n=1 Tax=Herbiconiux moechotypicola TaxID=637393 RepID=A0ABN3DGC2_9MICO